jgi:RNA polymerase sigma-70 factor (ECF subfamily)
MRNASAAWLRRTPPDEVHDVDPAHLALMDALRQLPDKQRVAIVLHHLVDLPVAQVAAETGCTAFAVKQQLARGRAALAELLADEDRDPELRSDGAIRAEER